MGEYVRHLLESLSQKKFSMSRKSFPYLIKFTSISHKDGYHLNKSIQGILMCIKVFFLLSRLVLFFQLQSQGC